MSTERLSHASSTFARPVERHGNAFSVKHMPVGTTVWNMRPTVAIVQMDHDFGVARQSINPLQLFQAAFLAVSRQVLPRQLRSCHDGDGRADGRAAAAGILRDFASVNSCAQERLGNSFFRQPGLA